MPSTDNSEQDQNMYRFRVWPGRLLEELSMPFNIVLILFTIACIWVTLADNDGDGADKPIIIFIFLLPFTFLHCLRRILFRKLKLALYDDRVVIVYTGFLFLPRREAQLYFSHMTECKNIMFGRRIRRSYLKLTMTNGVTYKVIDDIRWFKKIDDYSLIFSTQEVAEAHQRYRQSISK